MTKKRTFSIHNAFAILLSLSFLIAGICLICGCLTIYFSGDQPYSREAVAEVFKKLCLPIYICLILTVLSFIWDLISPLSQCKKSSIKDYKSIIDKLSAKKDLANADEEIIRAIAKENQLRKTHILIRTAIICVSSILFLIYALNSNNFHQSEINSSMIKAMTVMLPCLAISFAYSVFTAFYNIKSYERELELVKKLSNTTDTANTVASSNNNKIILIVKSTIVFIAIGILIYGYFAGGTADVLTKAINICTECIGLG